MRFANAGTLVVAALGGWVLGACSGPSAGLMTAEQHHAAAAQHDERAEQRRASAAERVGRDGHATRFSAVYADQAAGHAAHARVHRDAALALERIEATACVGIPAGGRAECPLHGKGAVDAALAVSNGYSLRLPRATDVAATQALVDCHIAHAFAAGVTTQHKDQCPLIAPSFRNRNGKLFQTTATVEARADGIWLTISNPDVSRRAEIGRRLEVLGLWPSR